MAFQIACEIGEEVFLDPWVEAYVSHYIADNGGSMLMQVLGTSFAESFRETFMSAITGRVGKTISHAFKTKISTKQSQQLQATTQNSKMQQREAVNALKEASKPSIKSTAVATALSALAIFTAPVFGPLAAIAIGTTAFSSIIGVIKTFNAKQFLENIEKVDKIKFPRIPRQVQVSHELEDNFDVLGLGSLSVKPVSSQQMIEKTAAMVQYKRDMSNYQQFMKVALQPSSMMYLSEIPPPSPPRRSDKMKKRDITNILDDMVDNLLVLYKDLSEVESDPIQKAAIMEQYIRMDKEEQKITGVSEKNLRTEFARRVHEIKTLNRMTYFEFFEFYVNNFDNYYTRHFKSLDLSNSIGYKDPSAKSKKRYPNSQTRLLAKYMELRRKASKNKEIPYLIYALINRKDLRLHLIDRNPLIRVGHTKRSPKQRLDNYKIAANAGKKGNIYKAIKKQGIDDFKFLILDIQLGRDAALQSEEFFTIYFNRDIISRRGFDLSINRWYNLVVGDLVGKTGEAHPAYIELFYEEIKSYTERGYEELDIAALKGVGSHLIWARIQDWEGGGENFVSWSKKLRAQKLIEYYTLGLLPEDMTKYFEKLDIPDKRVVLGSVDSAKKYMESVNYDPPVIHYSAKRISQWTQKYLGMTPGLAYEKYYVKPIVITLLKLGYSKHEVLDVIEAMGITNPNRKGSLYDGNSFDLLLVDRLWGQGLGKRTNEMSDIFIEPIIEAMIRQGSSLQEIADVFGRSVNFIYRYIKRRWGFSGIKEARIFFKTHYLGIHDYDYYAFS